VSQSRSEWARLSEYKSVTVNPSNSPVSGRIRVPGSKSLTNRALILAAAASGMSAIHGILKSDDSFWCIDSLQKLGVKVVVEGDTAFIHGTVGKWAERAELFIGSAGTTARFLPGILASAHGGAWTIRASQQLMQRPIRPLVDALQTLGAQIRYVEAEGHYPIQVIGAGIHGGSVSISGGLSSQFISGLLMCAPLAERPVHITVTDGIVQHAYVHLTLDLMRKFGVEVEASDDLDEFIIRPGAYQSRDIELEADASTAGYFLALAAITNGSVRIVNLGYETRQPDIRLVDIFERMGCSVQRHPSFVEVTGTSQLKGGFTVSMREMSDQTPTLAAIAPFADGPITITDVAHIRKHESDRIHAMSVALTQLGIRVEEREDGMTVYPGTPKPATLETYDDHRIAMALALIGAKSGGVTLLDPGCVSKTCPTYFDDIKKLGVQVDFEPK
jgi:3-phosphoshikimate 1-carboxyvinyltransferase